LILGGGDDSALDRQIRQKCPHFRLAHVLWVPPNPSGDRAYHSMRATGCRTTMEQNKPPNPLQIRLLRPPRQVLEAHDFPALVQEFQLGIGQKPFLWVIKILMWIAHNI